MSKYENPVPVILEEPVAKRFSITFEFTGYVTREEAAEQINGVIKEQNGVIPEKWIVPENEIIQIDKNQLSQCDSKGFSGHNIHTRC